MQEGTALAVIAVKKRTVKLLTELGLVILRNCLPLLQFITTVGESTFVPERASALLPKLADLGLAHHHELSLGFSVGLRALFLEGRFFVFFLVILSFEIS